MNARTLPAQATPCATCPAPVCRERDFGPVAADLAYTRSKTDPSAQVARINWLHAKEVQARNGRGEL
jgi:hypothetical protein